MQIDLDKNSSSQFIHTQELQSPVSITYTHQVYFSQDIFSKNNHLLAKLLLENKSNKSSRTRVSIFVDEGVTNGHPHVLKNIKQYFSQSEFEICPPVIVEGGEKGKNGLDQLLNLIQEMKDFQLCRHSWVIVIGGGSVLDCVGMAASLVHRGVRLIRVPSTVLAQVDAGIGVKNGINFEGQKNFLGTFNPPHAIVNDSTLLHSLSDEHWKSGIAEAIKVALIKDKDFFNWIKTQVGPLKERDREVMSQLIFRGAKYHFDHIVQSQDSFERGSTRPLDYGHWLAHKLEQLSQFQIPHGYAVAMGMAVDALYANLSEILSDEESQEIISVLHEMGFKLWFEELDELLEGSELESEAEEDEEEEQQDFYNRELHTFIKNGLNEFQEHMGGDLHLPLLKGIGSLAVVHHVDTSLMEKAILMLRHWSKGHINLQ